MASGSFCFERFVLDPADRRLCQGDTPVELNGRYFDALALMVREQGKLVSKDRFLDEVWRGVPVTDEALTQCIKTIRKQLGDSASTPQFIETVPKHGYRFIAPVEWVEADGDARTAVAALPIFAEPPRTEWRELLTVAGAGTVGGGLAGIIGGLFYGLAGASQPLQPGLGAVSVLLVLVCLTEVAALLGAAGVSLGIAASRLGTDPHWFWSVLGGATGGLVVGAVTKLLGLDAFNLLVGQSPGDITGGGEGALLGGAVGLGAWLGGRARSLRRGVALAAIAGGAAGVLIPLLGGQLMGGSLDLLASSLPGSRLQLDQIGALLGEEGFGTISRLVTGGLEGMLFGGCLVGAMLLAKRNLGASRDRRGHNPNKELG